MRSSPQALAALLGVLAATALVTGCAATRGSGDPPSASSRFVAAYEAGRFAEATRAFESDARLRSDPETAVRAALAYAHPAHPARAPERARSLLRGAGALDPVSLVSRDAAVILAMLDAERDLRARLDGLRAELDALKAIDLERREPPSAPPGADSS
jgi:hypothetical protein